MPVIGSSRRTGDALWLIDLLQSEATPGFFRPFHNKVRRFEKKQHWKKNGNRGDPPQEVELISTASSFFYICFIDGRQ
jgi:hypothetical protein